MFGNHRLLKVAWLRFVLAGILFATPAVKAQSSREKSAASYFARGIEWQARGEFDRAIADFGIAIAFDPHFARAYYMRARAHLSNGDVKAALVNAEGYNNRANACYAKGDYEGAMADYNRALALNPRSADVYAHRGMLWLRLGRPAEAEADFEQCVALNPDMNSSLEQRINQLQAQFLIQTS